MNTENCKTSEAHKFVLNLLQDLNLEAQINMLILKTYLFITRGKV